MLSNAKHLLADHTLLTVIPREHSDRGNLLAILYTINAGCRWSALRRFFTSFRMTLSTTPRSSPTPRYTLRTPTPQPRKSPTP